MVLCLETAGMPSSINVTFTVTYTTQARNTVYTTTLPLILDTVNRWWNATSSTTTTTTDSTTTSSSAHVGSSSHATGCYGSSPRVSSTCDWAACTWGAYNKGWCSYDQYMSCATTGVNGSCASYYCQYYDCYGPFACTAQVSGTTWSDAEFLQLNPTAGIRDITVAPAADSNNYVMWSAPLLWSALPLFVSPVGRSKPVVTMSPYDWNDWYDAFAYDLKAPKGKVYTTAYITQYGLTYPRTLYFPASPGLRGMNISTVNLFGYGYSPSSTNVTLYLLACYAPPPASGTEAGTCLPLWSATTSSSTFGVTLPRSPALPGLNPGALLTCLVFYSPDGGLFYVDPAGGDLVYSLGPQGGAPLPVPTLPRARNTAPQETDLLAYRRAGAQAMLRAALNVTAPEAGSAPAAAVANGTATRPLPPRRSAPPGSLLPKRVARVRSSGGGS